MQLSDFDYELPPELIAKYPLTERSSSRLLSLDIGKQLLAHHGFRDLPSLLKPSDLLVFNKTKVIPARLFAHKVSGGKVEILLERIQNEREFLAHCRASHLKPGHELWVTDAVCLKVVARVGALYQLQLVSAGVLAEVFKNHGHMPLPPYLARADEMSDQDRYQTVYAEDEGSVAAPTAGLHFDADLLQALTAEGIEHTFVSLHVGAGTFQPVKTENITEHQMHGELYEISTAAADKINQAKRDGRRIVAVGTTSVRSLESAVIAGEVQAGAAETHIFIYPGYQFQVVDALITNFHLPKSSLLMLVSAFAGTEFIKSAYREAIKAGYRFFSYGDAMLLLP